MKRGTHDYPEDPRNASVLIYVNGELVARDEARVSVFDSGFMLGDGVWESFRLHEGQLLFIDEHLDRLWQGLKALDIDLGMSRTELRAAIEHTVAANEMHSGVHLRLMITRGVRATPYQDPRVIVSAPTIVIVPEYKTALESLRSDGIRLFTVHVRRGRPDVQDPKLNSHSKLNCITACIQAAKAGADEALMLDPHGFVATCNSTHFFIVRGGEVWTSSGRYCLPGITRAKVIALCRRHDIPVFEKDFSLAEVYGADEAFVTGTFAGLVRVREIDGRVIRTERGPMVTALQEHFDALIQEAVG